MFATYVLQSDIDEIIMRLGDNINALKGKSILFTGAYGFLGRYFLSVFEKINTTIFSANPVKVTAIDNLMLMNNMDIQTNLDSHITFLKYDIIKSTTGLDMPLDYIVHAAGIASPHYYRQYPLQTLDVEVIGTRNLLDLAQQNPNCRFLKFSSSEIYGDPHPDYVPIKESYRGNVSTTGPRSCYDEGKRLAETLCYIYSNELNVHTNTVRPFNVFGPGMQELDYRVMPNFASHIKANTPLKVYGQGNQTRTFTYITDAIVGFFLVLLNGGKGETYNVGNPVPEVSMLDLIAYFEAALGKKVNFEKVEYPNSYPEDEPRRRCPDINKIKNKLDFKPLCDLEDGLKRFLYWTNIHYKGIQ